MYRTEIFSALTFFVLTCSVCGLTQLRGEEGANTTLQWDSPTSLEHWSLIIYCFLTTPPQKMVFEMTSGGEQTGQGRGPFSGRVHWDREALRLGQVRIHLTGLTPQDTGRYWCYMYANYDPEKKHWAQVTSEDFSLKVTTHGQDSVTRTNPGTTREQGKSDLSLLQKILLCLMFGSMALTALGIVVQWVIHHMLSRTKESLIPV